MNRQLHNPPVHCLSRLARTLSFWAALLAWLPGTASAAEGEALRLAVHPILPQERTREVFQPLAEYLSARLDRPVELITTTNFLSHWQLFKRENYELVLDGPHFTDYRVQKMGYRPVVKLPSVASYSLVTDEESLVLEPSELVARKVATLPSPGLGALRLNGIFPNPLRQPTIVEVNDSTAAVKRVLAGEVVAAMIPTPLVGPYPELVPVTTTEPFPAPGISASPAVDRQLVAEIREALLSAGDDPAGQAVLEAVNIPGFEPADQAGFEGQAQALEEVWGY